MTKMVCERWSVTVCERLCVTKLCVKHGVSKMVGDNVVCERWCVKDGVRKSLERGCVKDGV